MTQITENFTLENFNCEDGTSYPEEWIESRLKPLCQNLEILKLSLGSFPIKINVGYVSPEYYKKNFLKEDLLYSEGIAVCLSLASHDLKDIYKTIEELIKIGKMKEGGLQLFSQGVYYDISDKKKR